MLAAQDPTFKRDDVQKAMRKVYELSFLEDPPLRFMLGLESVTGVRTHLREIQEELDVYDSWSNDLTKD